MIRCRYFSSPTVSSGTYLEKFTGDVGGLNAGEHVGFADFHSFARCYVLLLALHYIVPAGAVTLFDGDDGLYGDDQNVCLDQCSGLLCMLTFVSGTDVEIAARTCVIVDLDINFS